MGGAMRETSRCWVALGLASLLVAGCAGRDSADMAPMLPAGELFTLVNLHVDPKGHRVFTTNYQSAILLPLCTRVVVTEQTSKLIRFSDAEQGVEYVYLRTKHLRESFAGHLAKVFGSECVSTRVAAMSEIDRRGISEGRALPGMSKDAVILAMGYPPDHATPSLAADRWTYWRNRATRTVVHFSDGVVTYIQ